MKIMVKIQSMKKTIDPTDGHTDSDDKRPHTFITRGLKQGSQQQIIEPVKKHVNFGHTKYPLT